MRLFIRRMYFLGIIFTLLMALNTYIGFRQFEVPLRQELERSMINRQEYIVGQLSNQFKDMKHTLDLVGIMVQVEEEEAKLRYLLGDLLEDNPSFLALYFVTVQNNVIYANNWNPPADLDSKTRPWYQQAVASGELIITDPYRDLAADRFVITLAKPVYDENGVLLGVVGGDQRIDYFMDFLGNQKSSDFGSSVLFTVDGDILVHSQERAQGPEARIELVLAPNFNVESSGLYFSDLHDEEGYFSWQRLPETNLVVGTFAPRSDILASSVQARRLLLQTLLASTIIFFLLFIFQRKYLVKPMKKLEHDILGISLEKDLTYRLPVGAPHSFVQLRSTLNHVLAKTQEYLVNMTHQQEELSAAYAQLVAHEQELQEQYKEIQIHRTEIQYLADHDSLTGIFNRRKFEEDLASILVKGQAGSVFLLDIDNFKNINDIQGHMYGDRVLRFLAKILKENLPPEATVYRFGGDEFLVLTERATNRGQVEQQVAQISRYLSSLNVIEGQHTHITASIGVACFPQDGQTVQEILIKADIAMHNAKKTGKNRYMFFSQEMASTFSERVQVERILIEAVQTEGFTLVYQPIIHADTGDLAYFEALIRLKDHSIPPGVFIRIAEESTLILPIGRWVIKAVIKQILHWQKAGYKVKPISINLSPRQFYDDGFVEFLANQLKKHQIDPGLIEIEITETVLIDNAQEAIRIIEKIKGLGIKMVLDDFGTGYSSINYITQIPVDRIKIDRSMTQKLIENISVLSGLVTIAHGLEMEVVAEGVETENEARQLIQVDCNYLQGYLFSKPLHPDEAIKKLEVNYAERLGFNKTGV